MTTHTRRRKAQVAATATVALALVGAALSTTGPAQATSFDHDLKAVRTATARLHSTAQALAAGYLPSPECVSSPLGGMGFHWENPALMADPTLDPAKPEILLFAPDADGDLHLVGVEYFRSAAQATATPELFGHDFEGPMAGHHPGMPVHFDLHVWVWKTNPSGTFAQFNPTVSC